MPSARVFRSLGLLVEEDFLGESDCRECRAAILTGRAEFATIRAEGAKEEVDTTRRSVHIVAVPRVLRSKVSARVSEIKPVLEKHFDVTLADCESPQFLTYGPGHFYVPHADSTDDPAAPDYMRERRVSVVIFLDAASTDVDVNGYGGGALTFYGLIKHPAFASCGLPVDARPGMLIAFPSSVVHEVRPVTRGQRHTIATWFRTSTPERRTDHASL